MALITSLAGPAIAHSPASGGGAPAGNLAMSRIIAAQAAARADAARTWGTGFVSGVLRTPFGTAAGSCVTVTGPRYRVVARTGPGGRYLLGGLRPGRYLISASACANAVQASRRSPISASWTTGPATLTVRAGQVTNPTPVSLWYLSQNWLALARRPLPAIAGARPRSGSISGVVTGHGHPQREVCAIAESLSNRPPAFAVSSRSGAYRIGKLRPGKYQVVFVAGIQHCPNKGNWLEQWYPRVNFPYPTDHVKVIRVRAGAAVKGIDASLKAGGEIAGTVRDTSGKAVPGICVSVFGNVERGQAVVTTTLITDKAGRYALHGAFGGKYLVEFFIGCGTKGNYAFQWWHDETSANRANTIRIAGTRKVTGIDARLRPGATVAGVVKAISATGKPLAGVCVDATGSDGSDDAFATTVSGGAYRLKGLAAFRYQISFDPSCIGDGGSPYLFVQRNLTVATGQAVTGFNAYLPIGGGISGLVTDAGGRPVGGVCVVINDDNGDATRTRQDGRYSISGVEPGSFTVLLTGGCGNEESLAPQLYHQPPGSLFATPIRFRPDTITPNVDVRMLAGGTLAGAVTDTAGRRLSRICVAAFSSGPFTPPNFGEFNATTEGGRYLIKNLPPSAYELSFGCHGYGKQWFPSQPSPVTSTLLAVNGGVTTRVGARLSRGGAITGTVRRSGGKPLGDACVQATPAGNRTELSAAGFAITGKNGGYAFGGLAPGRYLVLFNDCDGMGAFGSQWYRRQPTESSATPVTVTPGRTDRGINALITAAGSIAGQVTGPSGKPANGICVEADSTTAQSFVTTHTGRLGRYRLAGLSTGRWSVTFISCSNRKPDLGSLTRAGIRVTAPRTVAGVNVRMPPGGSVSGTVVSRAGGTPISSTCVAVLPVNPNGSFGFGFTNDKGRYIIRHLAPGRYHVYMADPVCDVDTETTAAFAPQWYPDQALQANARTIRLPGGGSRTGVNGALTLVGAISGTVENRAHAAVAGECVTAVPFRSAPDPVTGSAASPEIAITGRTGRYTLTTLMPGRYKVEFATGCGDSGFATQWWDNAGSARSATVITVRFASIAGIDATLRR